MSPQLHAWGQELLKALSTGAAKVAAGEWQAWLQAHFAAGLQKMCNDLHEALLMVLEA